MSKQSVKTTINDNIKQNGHQAITGPVLNSVLNEMVDNLAEEASTTEKLTELEGEINGKKEIIEETLDEYFFYFIPSSYSVGAILNQPVKQSSSSPYYAKRIDVSKGDAIHLKVSPYKSTTSAWLYTTNDKNPVTVIDVAPTGAVSEKDFVATQDGYLFVSAKESTSYEVTITRAISHGITGDIEDISQSTANNEAEIENLGDVVKDISKDVNIDADSPYYKQGKYFDLRGDVIDRNAEKANGSLNCIVSDVLRGDKVYITTKANIGSSQAQPWVICDNDGNVLQRADKTTYEDYEVSVLSDGFIIVNGVSVEPKVRIIGGSINILKDKVESFGKVALAYQGKKAYFMGDSITWGYSPKADGSRIEDNWVKLVGESMLLNVVNLGISGSTIAVNESNPTDRHPMVDRLDTIGSDADLIVIAGGTNDWRHKPSPFGNVNVGMSDATKYSFCGALDIMCRTLIEEHPSARVVFITPIHRLTSGVYHSDIGKTLRDYADAIVTICNRYSIPVIDAFDEIGIVPQYSNGTNTAQYDLYIPDGTHPNEAGHLRMAEYILKKLSAL